mgnify:CR=1 FL=1
MSEQAYQLWRQLTQDTSPDGILQKALQYTQYNMKGLITESFQVEWIDCQTHTLDKLNEYTHAPEDETVAVYLKIGDTLAGHALLVFSMADAYQLVAWLLDEPVDTTLSLDPLMSSALAELGNVMVASFLNAFSQLHKQTSILPSPPAVIVDMLATVMEVVATAVAATSDKVTIIEADFKHEHSDLLIRLWLLPDPTIFIMPNK